jgi:hypothetical protein
MSRDGQIERESAAIAAVFVTSDRRVAFARYAEHGVPTRLVVNGSGRLAPEWSVLTRPRPWQPGRIIVLASAQGEQTTRVAPGGDISNSTEPPSCRGPPSGRRSSHAQAVAAPKPSLRPAPAAQALSGEDPVVRDNLGEPIAVAAAEVAVIETYLGPLLDELLGSPAGSDSRKT